MTSERKVRWSKLALARVEEIADFIARDKPGAAHRWVSSSLDAGDSLRTHAERGRVVPELGRPEIRELLQDGYRVVYRVDEGHVMILTVRHGRQLLERNLDKPPG